MTDTWTERWNERYRNEEFAYGTEPNDFLKEELLKLKPGKILFAAEGEGRNAVYAAKLGWDVSAFDISEEGKKKALILADKNKVELDYRLGELNTLGFSENSFDALALIYAHFPADIKSDLHKSLNKLLRRGAVIIFEAFSKNHLEFIKRNEKVGGPRELAMLFSVDELKNDFPDFEIYMLEERVIELNEGDFHNGTGSVIRFIGRKK